MVDELDRTQISIREILAPLRRERSFLVLLCLAAMVTSLTLTYVTSQKYQAVVGVFYRPREAPATKLIGTQSFGSPMPIPEFRVIGATLQDIARNEAILRRVVVDLNLDRASGAYEGPWYIVWYRWTKDTVLDVAGKAWSILKHGRIIQEDDTFAAMEKLFHSISIVSGDSFVYYVVVVDKVPERAAQVADRIAESLVTWLRDSGRGPGIQKVEQINKLLGGKAEQIKLLREQIDTLLVENQTASIGLEIERDMDRWSRLELSRSEIEGRIRQNESKLSDLEQKLRRRDEPRSTTARAASESFPAEVHRELTSTRVFTEVELRGFEARDRSVEQEIEHVRNRLKTLPSLKSKFDSLQIELDSAERDYVTLRDAYQEAQLQATLPLSEAEVLHRAHVPRIPIMPIKIYHVALSGFLALLLGIGIVYLTAFFGAHVLAAPADDAEPTPDAEPAHAAAT